MSNSIEKIAFHTLGCKLNFSESSTISRDFKSQGFYLYNNPFLIARSRVKV